MEGRKVWSRQLPSGLILTPTLRRGAEICMVAQVCGLKPGDFVHCCGDTHVYSNHVEPLYKQLDNEPRPFPTLKINPEKKDIDSFEFSDFEIVDYDPHPKIAMQMAV